MAEVQRLYKVTEAPDTSAYHRAHTWTGLLKTNFGYAWIHATDDALYAWPATVGAEHLKLDDSGALNDLRRELASADASRFFGTFKELYTVRSAAPDDP